MPDVTVGRILVQYSVGEDIYRLSVEIPPREGADEPGLALVMRSMQLAALDLEDHIRRERFPKSKTRPRREWL